MARSGGGRTSGSHSTGSSRGSSSGRTSGSHRSTSSRSSMSKSSGSRRSSSGLKLPSFPIKHRRKRRSGNTHAVLRRLARSGNRASKGFAFSPGILLKPVISLVVLVLLISVASNLFGHFSKSDKPTVPAPAKTVENATTVYQIKPLDPSLSKETAYYEDKLGWLTADVDIMEEQLKIFQSVTGIRPFVYMTDAADYQANGETLYDTLFDDEAHFLLVIEGKLNANGEEVWNAYYHQGTDAAGVMNDNIISLFWDNYDYNYGLDSSDAQCIGYTFSHTAAALTVVSEDNDIEKPSPVQGIGPAPIKKTSSTPMVVAALILIFVIMIVIILAVANYRKTMSFDLPDDDSIAIPEVPRSPYDPVDAPVRAVEWDESDAEDEPVPEEEAPAAEEPVLEEKPAEEAPAAEEPIPAPPTPRTSSARTTSSRRTSSSMNIPSFLGAHMDAAVQKAAAPAPEETPDVPEEPQITEEAPESSGGYYLNGIYYPGEDETKE